MSLLLEKHLGRVRRPSRYLGEELFSANKEPEAVKLHFALAFPDLYEVGMSYVGLQILYHILNRIPEVWAERVFTPAPDMAQLLKDQSIPLPALETGRPLKEFDLVGFSLTYELGFTNVLQMLSLGKIPIWSRDRTGENPIVIAGGPCTFNPEPMSAFFDLLVIGDGEEVIQEICQTWLTRKKEGRNRTELLHFFSELSGVYVPALHSKNKIISIKKRVIPDINQVPYPAVSPLPYQQIIHDRLSIEIARGCTRGCRFCQAGIIYRPVRERSPEQVYQLLEEGIKRSGYAEATLLSLSSGDYTCLNTLLPALMERWEDEKVAVSLPSLRVDTLSPEVIEQILRVRKTGFTIAPEAGTQRLRDVINKNITEEEIIKTAQTVFSLGWRVLKLYFMIGLPTETQEDLEGLIQLVQKIEKGVRKKGRRYEIHVALSIFIPKPHTPFQWTGQLTPEESLTRLTYIRSSLKSGHVQVKWNDPYQSFLEAILSRGDRSLSPVIYRAFKKGCLLDGWGEYFFWEGWQRSFEEEGLNPQEFIRIRSEKDFLAWDVIDPGVDKTYLWGEYQKGLGGESTADCRQGACNRCGVCPSFEIQPLILSEFSKPAGYSYKVYPRQAVKKFRLLLTKTGPSRFLGYLEWKEAIIRALRRAELPLAFSQGFHPLPRLSFGPALPVGLSSLGEFVDVQIADWMNAEQIRNRLKKELFPGTQVLKISEVPLNSHLPQNLIFQFQVEMKKSGNEEEKIKEFIASTDWMVEKPGKKSEALNLRKLIRDLFLRSENNGTQIITWTLESRPEGEIRPDLVLRSLFNLPDEVIQGLTIVKSLVTY